MEGLKPCPFCCGEAEIRSGSSTTPYVRCVSCGCRTGSSRDVRKAIAAWNNRAERTCKVRQAYFDSDNELHEIMEGIAFSPEDTVACICEACGHDWRYDRGIRPNYCPNCGAKVVE